MKKSLKFGFILYFLLLLTITFYPKQINRYFKHISIKQGLSQVSVWSIVQDKQGFMWFGTDNGLNKYDGYKFTIYRHNSNVDTSLTKNTIPSLCDDSNGILWIGTDGGGLNRFDKKNESFINYQYQKNNPNSLSDNFISSIIEDKDGFLWIGTFSGGLNKFNKVSKKFKRYKHMVNNPNSLSHNQIGSIVESTGGIIWVGTREGLNKFDKLNETFTRYRYQSGTEIAIRENNIGSLFEDSRGILWIGTNGGGLNKFNSSNKVFINYKSDPKIPTSISNDFIRTIYEDKEGNLWIGTWRGLNKFNRKTEEFSNFQHHIGDDNTLSSNNILSINEDTGGILWIGTYSGGLNKYDKKNEVFSNYTQLQGNPKSLSGKRVLSFYNDTRGTLWIGTSNGLNKTNFNLDNFSLFQFQRNYFSAMSVIGNTKGNLWLGTGSGVFKIDTKSKNISKLKYKIKKPDRGIMQVYRDTKNILWIATDGDGLIKFEQNKNKFTQYKSLPVKSEGLSSSYVWSIFEDSINTIWIGTIGSGLHKFNHKSDTFTSYQHQQGSPHSISSNHVLDIFEDTKYNLWLGTDNGLNKFDRKEKKFQLIKNKNLSYNEVINGILEDNEGNIWLCTKHGLNKFDLKSGVFSNYDMQDGLQNNEFNDGAKLKGPNGRLFFGSMDGFIVFDPSKVVDNKYIPPVLITDFLLFNKSVGVKKENDKSKSFQLKQHINFTEEITLDYTDYIFAFEFSALNYRQSEKNKYKYKLEGFDKDWIETDYKQRRATYTNLSAGEYVFKVKASNDDGYWNNKGMSINVNILPPFWKTIWFKSFIMFLGVTLVFFLYRFILNKAKEKIRFEEKVKTLSFKNKLSKTEEEILFLILRGKSNKEIEDLLFISSGTIRNSNSRIYKKFKVGNRTNLILMFKNLD